MGNEEFGECSRKSGNSNINDRPLKKAKYVWQVKGKYHLKAKKENIVQEKENADKNKNSKPVPNPNTSNDFHKGKCIDKFLARTEAMFDSDEDDCNSSRNIEKSISSDIPVTLVAPNPKNVDYYLKKWQARQVARGYIDNTINSVLETWVSAPFDAEDFVDYCDDDGHVEDQGIMMAIQAHGLQSNIAASQKTLAFVRPDELADSTLDKIDTVRNKCSVLGEPCSSSDDRDIEASASLDIVYPVNILNAAILVAIERKGLSSHGGNKS